MLLSLPLRFEVNRLLDADGLVIALFLQMMAKDSEEDVTRRGAYIVAAVNSYAELLAAAYDAIIFLTRGDLSQPCPIVLAKLRAAIERAEQA